MKSISFTLMLCVALGLSACGKPKPKTVSEYLHDIDSARAVMDVAKTDIAKYQNDPNAINANEALSSVQFHNECWAVVNGQRRFNTANTDHACLDRAGYKR